MPHFYFNGISAALFNLYHDFLFFFDASYTFNSSSACPPIRYSAPILKWSSARFRHLPDPIQMYRLQFHR